MYDLELEFKKFYYNCVVLSKEETNNLRTKKKLNIDRLKSGLEEYNEQKNTNYKIAETLEQGSVAMSTVTQNEDNDYDIDVAIIFDENNLNGLGPIAVKNVIVEALKNKCINFKTKPEALTNCVRIVYSDNYHIDFAIYRRIKNTDDDSYSYEHAGSEWRERNPRSINNWFKNEIKEHGEKLRQAIRLSKMFCKSRTNWQMPGGLIQSVLCDEKIQDYSRIDEMFYYTMSKVKDRLGDYNEVYNPTSEQSLLLKQKDRDKINNLYTRLNDKINKLDILFKEECNEKEAVEAWYNFFNHDFWTYNENDNIGDVTIAESFVSKNSNNNILEFFDTEEFIENIMPIDIKYDLKIDCEITQDGYRKKLLRMMLKENTYIATKKHLKFYINKIDDKIKKPYDIFWKVKNEGNEAVRRNCIRGQVKKLNATYIREESNFKGDHYVECYIVKNNICVAKDHIRVPISNLCFR